jgi:hypothetical protein
VIVPRPKDYFGLLKWFKKYGKISSIPWSQKDYITDWRKGYLYAYN